MSDQLQIGEVAKLFNITTKTIRHYEKLDLLRPTRAENGYRVYTPEDVLTLQRIRQLQGLGLSLKQIKHILNKDGNTEMWETVLESLLQETQREIQQLEQRQKRLRELLQDGRPETVIGPPVQVTPSAAVYAYLAQYLPDTAQAQWHQEQTIFNLLTTIQHHPQLQTAVLGYLAAVPRTLTQLHHITGQIGLLPYGYIEHGHAPYARTTLPPSPNPIEHAWATANKLN